MTTTTEAVEVAEEVLMQPVKSKAKGKSKAVQEDVDLIAQTAETIENLSFEQAIDYMHTAGNDAAYNEVKMGGALSVILANKWYKQEPYNYSTIANFINAEVCIGYTKAYALMTIYDTLLALQVVWSDVSSIGWSKLAALAPVLTHENKAEWFEYARTHTRAELYMRIAVYKHDTENVPEEDKPTKITDDTVKLTFKLHPDQAEIVHFALEKAQLDAGTEYDSVALDAICQSYLGNSSYGVAQAATAQLTPEPAIPVDEKFRALAKEIGIEMALTYISEMFPEVEITVKM